MKKLFYQLLVLIILQNNLFAQKQEQSRIDSLLTQLPNAIDDTNKVNLLVDISLTYYTIVPDEGLKYGKEGLYLAKKLNWNKGIAAANRTIGVNYSYGKSEYSEAMEYYFSGLKIYEELGDKSGMATIQVNIGSVYYNQSKYPEAMDYYLKALKIFEKLGDKSGIARVNGNIGLVQWKNSKYPEATEYFFKALRMYEELGDKSGIARILGNIGIVYQEQKDSPNALEYYFKSLKAYESLGDKSGIARNLGNIGNVYFFKPDYPNALEYYSKALKMYEELGDKSGIARILGNIGGIYIYQTQKNYPKAWEFILKAIKVCEEIGDSSELAINLGNAGNLYLEIAKDSGNANNHKEYFGGNKTTWLNQANSYTKNAITIEEKIGDLKELLEKYKQLSEIQSLLKDNSGALASFKNYISLRDSVFNNENTIRIIQLRTKFESEIKAKEEKEQKEQKEHNRNLQILGIIIFLITFFFIILVLLKKKVKAYMVSFLGVLALLFTFEFIAMLIHPLIETWSNHSPIYMLLILVGIGAILVPTHHRIEHLVKSKVVHSIKQRKEKQAKPPAE